MIKPSAAKRLLHTGLLVFVASSAWAGDVEVKGRLVYAAPDGHKLRMSLFRPREDTGPPRPAVVLIHGGCWLFGTRHQLHWYARRFVTNGYVAASISYRMMPGHCFPDCLHDCKAAVRWMRFHAHEYGIDPQRIVVLGNSAGGHLAALAAMTTPEHGLEGSENPGVSSAVQAAVILYGVTDLAYYRNPRGPISFGGLAAAYVKAFVAKAGGQGRDPLEVASPITYAGPKNCPVLFVHGAKDHIVPYAQSVALCEQLKRCGVPTRLITVPYGHAFDFLHHKARRCVFTEMLAFLDQQVGKS